MTTPSLTAEEIAEGWIAHDGGPCPVNEGSLPKIMLRDGKTGFILGCALIWEHDGRGDDIIAYKPENPNA
jgi:hypothetical protein